MEKAIDRSEYESFRRAKIKAQSGAKAPAQGENDSARPGLGVQDQVGIASPEKEWRSLSTGMSIRKMLGSAGLSLVAFRV